VKDLNGWKVEILHQVQDDEETAVPDYWERRFRKTGK
jgi:hypothetical protein